MRSWLLASSRSAGGKLSSSARVRRSAAITSRPRHSPWRCTNRGSPRMLVVRMSSSLRAKTSRCDAATRSKVALEVTPTSGHRTRALLSKCAGRQPGPRAYIAERVSAATAACSARNTAHGGSDTYMRKRRRTCGMHTLVGESASACLQHALCAHGLPTSGHVHPGRRALGVSAHGEPLRRRRTPRRAATPRKRRRSSRR